jgi:hypothetical protein
LTWSLFIIDAAPATLLFTRDRGKTRQKFLTALGVTSVSAWSKNLAACRQYIATV